MDSLATILRRIPLFADLPAGNFARIIADLREERHEAGSVICYEGDEARDFYVIKSGIVEVQLNLGGAEREVVAVSGPSEWFGERALFSDRPRSATVVAQTPVELWRLPKDKFDAMIEENPWLMFHFAQILSDRLYRNNQELSKLQVAFERQMDAFLAVQPRARQELLTRSAILSVLDPDVMAGLVPHADRVPLGEIESCAALLARHDGGKTMLPSVRDHLVARLSSEVGPEGIRQLHREAARLYLERDRWDQSINHLLAAEEYGPAAELIGTHLDTIRERTLLNGYLRQMPAEIVERHLPGIGSSVEAALQPDTATASGTPPHHLMPVRVLSWAAIAVGIIAGLVVWTATPPPGLTPASLRMIALLVWAATLWAFDVFPDYVVAIGMLLGWIVLDVVPADVAVSGFISSPFFLIIGVLGIAASLQSSGLLFRIALHVLQRFPLTHRGQSLGLALAGTGINSVIPDVTSGVAIASPIVLAQSDSLGYARLSNGSAGLAMAAVLGFGQMSPFFLTGAAENLLAWTLLPEAAHADITWMRWFVAALPLALVTFVCGLTFTLLLLPPEIQPTVSRGLIATQLEALGSPSRAEWINGMVLVSAIIGWITARYHGLDVAWVAMIGLAILLATNLLDRTAFRAGIYWDFLFYLGAVLGLSSVVRHLGIDQWLIAELAPVLEPMAANPARFLVVLGLMIFAARFILPSLPLVSVLIITVIPIAAKANIHPLVLTLVICMTTAVWFLPYQSTYYLALYFGTKEKAFSHSQVRIIAWCYAATYLAAIIIAVPWWRMLGLLP